MAQGENAVVMRSGWRVLEDPARTALTAVASLLLAGLLRLPEAYWAPITAIVVTQSTLGAALKASAQRFAGTALGAVMGALVATYFKPSAFAFGLVVFVLGILCTALRIDQVAYRFAGITVAIVLLVPRNNAPWMIATHRFLEVSVGIAVALAVASVWPEQEV